MSHTAQPTIQAVAMTWHPHKHKKMSSVLFADHCCAWSSRILFGVLGIIGLFWVFSTPSGTPEFGLACALACTGFIASMLIHFREQSRVQMETYVVNMLNNLEHLEQAAEDLAAALPLVGRASANLTRFYEEVADSH